jgi:hypothetical protein
MPVKWAVLYLFADFDRNALLRRFRESGTQTCPPTCEVPS